MATTIYRNKRGVVAVCGAVCVFLLVVTGFILNSHPSGSFNPSAPTSDRLTSSSSSPKQSASAPITKGTQLPHPSEALQQIPKFENYGLSTAKCDEEFGPLFKEIERSAAHRQNIGKVTPADLDLAWVRKPSDGTVRAMIYRQKLFVLEAKLENEYYPPRALSILHQIDRAITASPELVPDIEFSFIVKDLPDESHAHHTFWALSRLPIDKETWLIPDFGYWSWPLDLVGAYEQIRVEIIQNQKPWEERVPKILWRGALKTNKVREAMYRITRGKKWADIEEVKWKNRTEVSPDSAASAISMVDHCDYQYLMHTEGRSYSGRGKYLLNCGSVVVTHKSEWIEPHQDLYVKSGPEQNIVEVERDFSDLEEKMQKLLQDPQLAHQIAMNSQKTFRDRYLTPAAQACYWRKLFRSWAEVSSKPEPFEIVNGKAKIRGIPFETFAIQALSQTTECSLWKKVTLQC